MADIFRNPLAVARRDIAPVLQTFVQPSRNLVIGLAAALPIGAAALGPAPDHRARLALGSDTTCDTPLTLNAERPVVQASHVAIARPPWLAADTTADSPATLLQPNSQTLPIGGAQRGGTIDRPPWLSTTIVGSPTALLATVAAAVPPGAQASWSAPPFCAWPNRDTSAGIPKAAYADAQLPIGTQQLQGISPLLALPSTTPIGSSPELLDSIAEPPIVVVATDQPFSDAPPRIKVDELHAIEENDLLTIVSILAAIGALG